MLIEKSNLNVLIPSNGSTFNFTMASAVEDLETSDRKQRTASVVSPKVKVQFKAIIIAQKKLIQGGLITLSTKMKEGSTEAYRVYGHS